MEYTCLGLSDEMQKERKAPVIDLIEFRAHFDAKVQVDTAVRVLSSIGLLVLIEWEEFGEDGEDRKKQLVVLEPKWLIES